jgi:peptidoglycan/xylan/chitin deacetylase (PgdA/CDA1 family)
MDHPERRGMAHRNTMPRTVLSPPMGQPLLPDVPNWSWHEYGMRAGFWRQFKALTESNIPTTLAINGNVFNSYPRVAAAARDAGFEFMGHGFIQGPTHKLDNQADAIRRTVDAIAAFIGNQPCSWESPGLTETNETLDLLRANGIEYVADWVIDDLPQEIETPYGINHDDSLHCRDERPSHPRTATFAGRAIRAALHRSVRSSLI